MTHLHLAFTLTPTHRLLIVARVAQAGVWQTLDRRELECDGATETERAWHAATTAIRHAARVRPAADGRLTLYSDLDCIEQLIHYQEFERKLMDTDTQAALWGYHQCLHLLIATWGGQWDAIKREGGFLA